MPHLDPPQAHASAYACKPTHTHLFTSMETTATHDIIMDSSMKCQTKDSHTERQVTVYHNR